MSRPAIHDRVAYSARYLASQPMAHFCGHDRGGFVIGEAAFKRGVLIGVAPDWSDIAFVRWDDQPEIAATTHIVNLVIERGISRDADCQQFSALPALAQALAAAREEGRVAGLEEAAKLLDDDAVFFDNLGFEAVPSAASESKILLASGNTFDLQCPERSVFTIEDIAQGLSQIGRFVGQSSRFYSVAQHSVFVSTLVPAEDALSALMHDAAEAFIGDVSRPLKRLLSDYRMVEKRVEAAVFSRFGLPIELPASVKDADMLALATEQYFLMPDREGRSYAGGKMPLNIILPVMSWAEARDAFLARYRELAPSPA